MQNIAPHTAIIALMIRPVITAALSVVIVLISCFILWPLRGLVRYLECKDIKQINLLYIRT